MISQHIYARSEKGLFTNLQGFDTVAKSQNLTEEFIKKYIHRYCVYDRPENNQDIYFFNNFMCNNKKYYIYGKSSYIYDKRDAYFTKSLIFDNFNFDILDFEFDNKIIYEHDLDVIDIKNIKTTDIFLCHNQILKDLDFNLHDLILVLNKITDCVLNNKQIFIKLSLDLVKLLRYYLPTFILEQISFITYMSDASRHNNFYNIVFLDNHKKAELQNDIFYKYIYTNIQFGNKLLIKNILDILTMQNFNQKHEILSEQLKNYKKLLDNNNLNIQLKNELSHFKL